MLSTPKRFAWSRPDRFAEFSFFRALLIRRRRPVAPKQRSAKQPAGKRWKPAPWTPWLWMK
jgi:hypothetical protein